MKSLNEDLKAGQFKQVYLLYGDEAYLKKQYKDKLSVAMVPQEDNMNYAYYEGKGVNVKEIIDLAETMPFFSERRLIVLENTGFFKNATPELADYIKEIPDTTYLIFVEQELDKRGKMFKAVKEKGGVVELPKQNEQTLCKWISSLVSREKKQISEATVRFILTKAGTDMQNLQQELEKLFCYTMDKHTITNEDVEEVCTTQITNQIFDMVNAVADKKQKVALDFYYELLALKEPPMRILYLLARQFRLLLQVKELDGQGLNRKQMSEKTGIHTFVIGKYTEQAKQFSRKELRKIMEDCAQTEEWVKTGRLGDVMGVELFIVKYSSPVLK
ncbi:DNA polymerase III subunit delta [Lachnospiraceae bacterium LCP25S3_G4]